MAITASMVKELRDQTGVGMMECKKALTESDGSVEKAVLWLRERGMSRAQKKAGRVTAEGIVGVKISSDNLSGVLLEVNCETDFVSKNEDFQKFVNEVSELALSKKAASVEELSSMSYGSGTVADTVTSLIAKIGENLQVRRVSVLDAPADGIVAGYSHMGGKIGSLVALKGSTDVELAKEVAMHTAASTPRFLNSEEVNQSELEQERELAKKKLLDEGKPAEMVDKILVGQMKKFFKEVCLNEQPFVKEAKDSVAQHVSKTASGATVSGFLRFQLGDGVEKKQEDFADEVAKLTGQ